MPPHHPLASESAIEVWRARSIQIIAYGADISLLQQVLRYGLSGLRAGGGI